jgi:hypothetical protein
VSEIQLGGYTSIGGDRIGGYNGRNLRAASGVTASAGVALGTIIATKPGGQGLGAAIAGGSALADGVFSAGVSLFETGDVAKAARVGLCHLVGDLAVGISAGITVAAVSQPGVSFGSGALGAAGGTMLTGLSLNTVVEWCGDDY